MAVSIIDVLSVLKPKVASLGLNKKEVESVATAIYDKLNLADDTTDEAAASAINTAVESALPFLAVTQSAVSRIVNDTRKQLLSESNPQTPQISNDAPKADPAIQALQKQIEALTATVGNLTAEKAANNRRQQLEDVLKDTGIFRDTTLKQFGRMSFRDDEDFSAYLAEVQTDAKQYAKDEANARLASLSKAPLGSGKSGVLSDGEIDEVVNLF